MSIIDLTKYTDIVTITQSKNYTSEIASFTQQAIRNHQHQKYSLLDITYTTVQKDKWNTIYTVHLMFGKLITKAIK